MRKTRFTASRHLFDIGGKFTPGLTGKLIISSNPDLKLKSCFSFLKMLLNVRLFLYYQMAAHSTLMRDWYVIPVSDPFRFIKLLKGYTNSTKSE